MKQGDDPVIIISLYDIVKCSIFYSLHTIIYISVSGEQNDFYSGIFCFYGFGEFDTVAVGQPHIT